jgi:hypothetical protein
MRSRRGPKTEEGKARSRMNATKHGLRARVLPLAEDAGEFAEFVERLQRTYRPEDDTEAELVVALAAAMWQEARAERFEAETLDAIAATAEGGTMGEALLAKPACRASLGTAIRYQSAASNAVRRAMDMLFKHRRARRDGLLVSGAEAPETPRTNELSEVANNDVAASPAAAGRPPSRHPATLGPLPLPLCLVPAPGPVSAAGAARPDCTNEFAPARLAEGFTPRYPGLPPVSSPPEPAPRAAARRPPPLG